MISLRGIDHVCLTVGDVEEARRRWSREFGLIDRGGGRGRAVLACEDEPYCLELVEGEAGHHHTAFELARACPLDAAAASLREAEVDAVMLDGALHLSDPEGFGIELVPYREREPWVAHARRSCEVRPGAPRRLGHVNCLSSRLEDGVSFYTSVLGMRVSDRLGSEGVWLRVSTDHHVMALMGKGVSHFHHLAFDTVDIGQMRDMLDRIARHGRWLGWGPARHGVGGNVASYVRIVEEACFVELYCDMEQLAADHEPRDWPDDRFSSNTWGPLPPRSYFRFDAAAVEWERESREMLGIPLPPEEPA
ncbi:MAG TPA: VOC family protein [Gaiellaceae bacterium]|nr:VOC family protein [Gaiellaceae bacterium]